MARAKIFNQLALASSSFYKNLAVFFYYIFALSFGRESNLYLFFCRFPLQLHTRFLNLHSQNSRCKSWTSTGIEEVAEIRPSIQV